MKNKNIITPFIIGVIILFLSSDLNAQESEAELAKATQNPVSDMYSLPFQNNTTYNNNPFGRHQNVLNIQPVIPVGLGSKVNLINRIIQPVVTQPSASEDESKTGLGDMNYTAWLSPKKASKLIYGVGPVFQIPTSTDGQLGTGEFGIGPSVVILTMINKWVAGIVANNIWTFGEVSENKFLFQYFVNFNLPKAWYLVSAPIMTANWNSPKGEQWIVPVGAGIGKVFRIGKLPLNFNAQVYYNAVKPDGVGEWQSRFQLQFLFPKKK